MIRTQSFQVNGATVTVREPIGIDQIDEPSVYGKLSYDRTSKRDRDRVMNFAEFVSRTVSIEGELGFAWATLDSDAATTQKAYDAWIAWDVMTMNKWIAALYEVRQSPGDAATQPDIDPNALTLPSE